MTSKHKTTTRKRWSAAFDAGNLHPRDERRVYLDVGNVLEDSRQKSGIADIDALVEAGYSKASAMHFGCAVAVSQAFERADVARPVRAEASA